MANASVIEDEEGLQGLDVSFLMGLRKGQTRDMQLARIICLLKNHFQDAGSGP